MKLRFYTTRCLRTLDVLRSIRSLRNPQLIITETSIVNVVLSYGEFPSHYSYLLWWVISL